MISGNGYLYIVDGFAGSPGVTVTVGKLRLLPGAELKIAPTALPGDFSADKPVTLIRYGVREGTFDKMPEGTRIQVGDYSFSLSYGAGKDAAITLVPVH